VRIGAHAVIGARSSIGPGCVVAPGEMLTACARLAPFTTYAEGKRQ
jgi:UDP-3-O-[3-hydroxymyristoyl] glucosamine N-acyltransferase